MFTCIAVSGDQIDLGAARLNIVLANYTKV
jgi:hypothetical protein